MHKFKVLLWFPKPDYNYTDALTNMLISELILDDLWFKLWDLRLFFLCLAFSGSCKFVQSLSFADFIYIYQLGTGGHTQKIEPVPVG